MNEITQKFNLYDHLAYILVGFYQIVIAWLLVTIIYDLNLSVIADFLKFDFTFTIILASYLVGHLVQAASNIFEGWEKAKKEEKKNEFQFVVDKARQIFNLPKKLPDSKVWQYCYLYALSNDFSGHVALFNSLYSLYRGLWVASCFSGSVTTLVIIFQLLVFKYSNFKVAPNIFLITYIILSILLCKLFDNRKKRFFDYLKEKTLITFDILSKGKVTK